ncbi:MAG: SDR family oxidoreductase [Chitinophagaceae bacterium]
MLLQQKNAVIFGAGGSLGSGVARALAAQGARVFLSGLHLHTVLPVADSIIKDGGKAEAAQVDAMDKNAIDDYVKAVVQKAGSIDIVFNAIGVQDKQGMALTEMLPEDFLRPISIAMQTQFLTGTAAARIMQQQHSGVILSLSSTPGTMSYAMTGGFGPVCCAIESLSRNLAAELGVYGIRVVCIRSAGSPDSNPFLNAMRNDPEGTAAFIKKLEDDTMLKQLPMVADIANVAAFLASDHASGITGVTIDVTCGTTSGLNYKMPAITFA